MTDTLDRIIYSTESAAENNNNHHEVIGFSGDLTSEDASQWRAFVTLAPVPDLTGPASQSVGIFAGPGRNFLLATVYHDLNHPMHEYVLIPRKLLQQAAGNVEPLIEMVTEPTEAHLLPSDTKITALEAPVVLPWTFEDRLKYFHTLLDEYAGGSMALVLQLLAAALDERHLLIQGFPGDTRARVTFVQGLMTLLPAHTRAELTFATRVSSGDSPNAMIIFADETLDTRRFIVDFPAGSPVDDAEDRPADIPYVAMLRDLWQGDEADFMRALADLEPLATTILPGKDMLDGLNQLTAQVQMNEQVWRGEAVDPAALKTVFASDLPLSPDLTRRYGELLLKHSLDARDTEAGLLVALKMDEDPELDAALNTLLTASLETQPDAVYVFIRTRLNDAMEADYRWIERLQAAALFSLKVAINNADQETIANWLRLIAREPASYNLSDILRNGILSAQKRACTEGDLARQLVSLAIKHTPHILDRLMDDEALLAAIPGNLGLVLRDYAGDPLYTLQNRGPEFFLVGMARAARAKAPQNFTPEVIDQLWKIYTTGQRFTIPEHYSPEQVIETLVTTGAEWLPDDILTHLMTLMLADGRDELFLQAAAHLAENDLLTPLLGEALHESQRSIDDVISIVSQLTSAEHLDQQAVADLYIELLQRREWRQTALPMVEHLARMIQQNPALDIEAAVFWDLLAVAMATRSETVARISAQQLFQEIEQSESRDPEDVDARLIETLLRLHESLQWSQQARQHLLKWWRSFVHRQPLARLSRLEKALENRKTLADCRAVVQSSLAFRRMIGNRSMSEFADAVNGMFSLLADISESFDPSPRQPTSFDEGTIRSELDRRRDELTDQQWHILAKNFKELAALIGAMGDHRSRGSLVRQNVDRQLLTGEQQPESAVDAMKWIAGYLEGVQGRDDEPRE